MWQRSSHLLSAGHIRAFQSIVPTTVAPTLVSSLLVSCETPVDQTSTISFKCHYILKSLDHSSFVFGVSRLPTRRLLILTEELRDFLQPFQANSRIASQIRP
jgi:hypothetical protein